MRDKTLGYLLVLPAVVMLLAITLVPTIYSYYFSVHDVRVQTFRNPPFVGLENYAWVLSNNEFWLSLRFTVLFTAAVGSVELLLGILIAVLFDRPIRGRRLFIAIILIPLGIAPALFSIMMKQMVNEFAGLIPYVLRSIGIQFSFFKDFPSTFMTIALTDIIEWVPFVFIIVFAALQALPREPFEAAVIDGASSWLVFKDITIPLLRPVLAVVIILRFMDAFKIFEVINIMTRGGPGMSTESISYFIYQLSWAGGYNNYGWAAAATIIVFYMVTIGAGVGLYVLRRMKVI